MKLSIIVPTYKVEPWIEKCLLSLVHQDLPHEHYEIIVVNDETPDESAAIARRLALDFPIIQVIDQKNKGLAGARNTGIHQAKGKYLLFIDSDDYIEPNVLNSMLDFAETNQLEIAMFGQNMVINEQKKPRDQYNPDTTEVMKGMDLFYKRTSDSACKYLILTEYLRGNDLYFFEQAVYLEDGEWSPRIFVKAERAAYKGIYFYNYVLRGESLVTSGVAVTQKAIEGYLKSARNLVDFQKKPELSETQKYFINQTIAKFVLLPVIFSANKKGMKEIQNIKKTIFKANFDKLSCDGVQGIRLKHVKLYNKSLYLLYFSLLIENLLKSINKKIK